MFELFISAPKSSKRLHKNFLAFHLERFSSRMKTLGYSHRSLRVQVFLLARLGNWLVQRTIPVTALNEDVIISFAASKKLIRRRGDYATLRRFLAYLREEKVISIPVVDNANEDPFERILLEYAAYLKNVRGLTPGAFSRYSRFVRKFFLERGNNIGTICPSDVVMFVSKQAKTMPRKRGQLMTVALKSFFRFLLQKGLIDIDIAEAVPSIANWRQVSVPRSLSPMQIEHLIKTCQKKRSLRDQAIILLLARLGLRACEIVRMELEDIDWQNGEILVRGKGRFFERLPLSEDIGKALIHYLKSERPASETRRVFIRSRPPNLGFANSIAISTIVRRLMTQAKIEAPVKWLSSHLFRHSLATRILKAGGTLGEIGEILRHNSQKTTEIYAKVDIEGLRSLAQVWPLNEVCL